MNGIKKYLQNKGALASALRISALFLALSVSATIIVALLFEEHPTLTTIGFALSGAVIQTAVLGLIYEVWLRNEVEDATLAKVGVSSDVRAHGVVRLEAEPLIDWVATLSDATHLCVATKAPERLFGNADDLIVRKAADGQLQHVRIAVPPASWGAAAGWMAEFKTRWEESAPACQLYLLPLAEALPYEIVSTTERTIVILPPVSSSPGVEAAKLIEFFGGEPDGTAQWLTRQVADLMSRTPPAGYAPPPVDSAAPSAASAPDATTSDPVSLT